MVATADMSTSRYEQIEAFTDTHEPPRAETRGSRVKPAANYELIIAGALTLGALVLILLTKLIGGASFMGDILTIGLIGLFCVGVVYALSTAGAWYMARRGSAPQISWTAVAILDKEKSYEDSIPVEHLHLELKDGRRVAVTAEPEIAARAEPGDIGWAHLEKTRMTRFVSD